MTTTTTSTGTAQYKFTPTKAQIVQRLLEEKQINAEEAVILLMSDKEYITLPSHPHQPQQPFNPYPYNPWITYSSPHTTGGITNDSGSNTTTQKSPEHITYTNS
jgi:hypothetical protein